MQIPLAVRVIGMHVPGDAAAQAHRVDAASDLTYVSTCNFDVAVDHCSSFPHCCRCVGSARKRIPPSAIAVQAPVAVQQHAFLGLGTVPIRACTLHVSMFPCFLPPSGSAVLCRASCTRPLCSIGSNCCAQRQYITCFVLQRAPIAVGCWPHLVRSRLKLRFWPAYLSVLPTHMACLDGKTDFQQVPVYVTIRFTRRSPLSEGGPPWCIDTASVQRIMHHDR